MRVGEHKRRKFAGRERRAEGMNPKTVQQHRTFFCIARIPKQILGQILRPRFWARVRGRSYSPYNSVQYIQWARKNRGSPYSPYGAALGTEIEEVCTVSLARFSRQLVGKKFDCKISAFNQFAEHCG